MLWNTNVAIVKVGEPGIFGVMSGRVVKNGGGLSSYHANGIRGWRKDVIVIITRLLRNTNMCMCGEPGIFSHMTMT